MHMQGSNQESANVVWTGFVCSVMNRKLFRDVQVQVTAWGFQQQACSDNVARSTKETPKTCRGAAHAEQHSTAQHMATANVHDCKFACIRKGLPTRCASSFTTGLVRFGVHIVTTPWAWPKRLTALYGLCRKTSHGPILVLCCAMIWPVLVSCSVSEARGD